MATTADAGPHFATPDQHALILESISDAFVALDAGWHYVYVNERAAQIFGRSREELVGKHIWTEFPEGVGQPFQRAYERALVEQCYVEIEEYYAPYDRWFENRIYPTPQGLSIFFHDVTDRKRAEAALRDSEAQLRRVAEEQRRTEETLRERDAQLSLIFDTVSDVLFLVDVAPARGGFRFASVNRAFLEATGLRMQHVAGQAIEDVIPPAALPLVLANYRAAIEQGVPIHWEEKSEYPSGTKHGEVTVAPVFDAHGRCTQLVGTVHDVTQHRQAERAQLESYRRMQSLSRQLVELQDKEHRRISAELHDRIGQNLTALGINLNIVEGTTALADAARARLEDSRALLDATMVAVRDLMTELRPVVLDDYGLLAGLRWYAERVQQRTGLAVAVAGDAAAPRLDARCEGALFRIAQEAVTNALKHAQAKQVVLHWSVGPARCELTVIDDGVGFDPERTAADTHAHLGLILMRERAESIGGTLRIESAPGRGTRVVVAVERAP